MTTRICMLTLGLVSTNCYVLGDDETHDALIIDPADAAPRILDVLKRQQWTARAILLTHTHFDHVLALGDVRQATGAPYYVHRDAVPMLELLPQTMQGLFNTVVPPPPLPPDHFIDEGDQITVGSIKLDVLFTPGHAPGHVSYVWHDEAVVFSGDSLFLGSIGRTDLPGCDHDLMMQSIFDKLLTLPDDYTLAAGHMQTTTIGRERASNPFLLDWQDGHRQ